MTKVDVRGRSEMRATVKVSLSVAVAALAACAHGGAPPGPAPRGAVPRVTVSAPSPSQYLVADPGKNGSSVAVPLGTPGALGLIVGRTRVVVGRGEPRVSVELPEAPFTGASRIPTRLGGGFLFWTDNALYRSDTFDGRLKPIVRTPDGIQTVAFAPQFLLVRTHNGERWALGLPSGERVAIRPLGATDVKGLDDGRALAFDDQGASFSSVDHGAHWLDVTAQLHSQPVRVAQVDDELWLFESGGGALRLEPDGHLETFDKQPPETPVEMRPLDARWRGLDAPLRAVFQRGATVDENTAIVIEQGDIVRVDVHTGEIVGITAGRLPPDAVCEAVPTANDVLFACTIGEGRSRSGSKTASMFVVSHTLSAEAPILEQSFPEVGRFFASDDGGLVISAPCNGAIAAGPPTELVACARQPGGTWQEYDLSTFSGDAGSNDLRVSRWIPRADGRAAALVLEPNPGIYDPRSGTLTPVVGGADALEEGAPRPRLRYRKHRSGSSALVDASWSFTESGVLRGFQTSGAIVAIADDGRVIPSPYTFEVASAGAFALGRSPEGRFYQSTDHGASWAEVLGPPSSAAAGDLHGCSTAGCDLAGFYRVGWAAHPPRSEDPTVQARPAPEVRRTPPALLTCRAAGPASSKILARTVDSPEDLGLGGARLAVAGNDVGFLRSTIARTIVHPLRAFADSETPSLRAMLTGFGTTTNGDLIEVTGPNKNPNALRRTFHFVPPFEPGAPVKRASFTMADVIAAGRIAGMSRDEILAEDMMENGSALVVTAPQSSAGAALAFLGTHGLVALVSPNERVKMAVRVSPNDATVVSGVDLGADGAAFLELESSGAGHVFSVRTGVTDLFDVNPAASESDLYPANPDALAVGPRGELAIIRTSSGSDPASAQDPALLLVPATPAVALAPWSTLRLSDDPACKEPGWRTTLQVIAPWVRSATPDLRIEDLPMLARVKWSDQHVCLEGLEVNVTDVSVRAPGVSSSEVLKVASWLVARGSTFARVAIADGVEWRQPLECSLVAAKP